MWFSKWVWNKLNNWTIGRYIYCSKSHTQYCVLQIEQGEISLLFILISSLFVTVVGMVRPVWCLYPGPRSDWDWGRVLAVTRQRCRGRGVATIRDNAQTRRHHGCDVLKMWNVCTVLLISLVMFARLDCWHIYHCIVLDTVKLQLCSVQFKIWAQGFSWFWCSLSAAVTDPKLLLAPALM